MKKSFFIVILIFTFVSCDHYREFIKETDYNQTATDDFGYDLLNPNKKYFMGYSLEEISGLSYVDTDLLACIQDESGKLYIYDTKKKAIVRRIKFHKGGDYEGVEVIGRTAYVIRSNGNLFRIPLDIGDKPAVEKIKTPFTDKNNIEGLGYDPKSGQLLVSCKNDGGIGDEEMKGKAVYAYDPIWERLSDTVLFKVLKKDLKAFAKKMNHEDRKLDIEPSAIALHPLEDCYYLLASSGKALIVINRKGEIIEFIKLRPAIFHQPEGICFSPTGTLYISSEGDGEDGYILKFKYNK